MDSGTSTTSVWLSTNGTASYGNDYVVMKVEDDGTLNPRLYFKLLKKKLKKFNMIQEMRLKSRIKAVEKAFDAAVENGQEALARKFLEKVCKETREATLYAKGYKLYVEEKDVMKNKNKIKGGHISDTLYADYTRVIPKDVIAKKKAAEPFFDEFIILHYWNEKAKDVKKMDPDERSKMRDPILFGKIKETNRWYFIADWEDEYCDLTFEKLIDYMGKDDEDVMLPKVPTFEEVKK
jgi:hypothetical protein